MAPPAEDAGIPTQLQEPEMNSKEGGAEDVEELEEEEEMEEDFENPDTPWKCLEGKVNLPELGFA